MNQILTVSGLNFYIKSQLESDTRLKDIYIKGEIFSFHRHFKSGHLYFSLKDEKSTIKVVMFSSAANNLAFSPGDGMKVLIRGSVSVYERDGVYQLYAKDMMPDGIGAKQLALQQLKEKLAGEGLFDLSRKRPIAQYPVNIAVITSKSGAAIRDIVSVCARRYPAAQLYLFAVSVQGEQAKPSILWAFNKINTGEIAFDTCILTRGGGAQEDLWIFNDEEIVRAVSSCKVPVISAIGHEIDTTLCDYAADRSAPTPSAAAEVATPDMEEIASALDMYLRRVSNIHNGVLTRYDLWLQNTRTKVALNGPGRKIEAMENRLSAASIAADSAFDRRFDLLQAALDKLTTRLKGSDPLQILSKGYAKVTSDSKAITHISQLHQNQMIKVNVMDGSALCNVLEISEDKHEI